MSHNCAYVRQHYQMLAQVGHRVLASGRPGVILIAATILIGPVLDEDQKKRNNYHPTHEMQHG